MRKKFIFSLLMIGCIVRANAQDGFVSQSTTLTYDVFDKNGKSFVNPAPDVAGSPFLKDDWKIATLILNNNRRYDSVKARLNLSSQEIHFLSPQNNELALAKGYIKEVI